MNQKKKILNMDWGGGKLAGKNIHCDYIDRWYPIVNVATMNVKMA